MAISAPKDANRIPVLIGTSNADGVTPILPYVDSVTNRLLVNATLTGSITASSAAVGATGAAVPTSADFIGLNVAGNLRGATGVNPSGTVYAEQVDIASVAGTTLSTGTGVMGAGTPRVTIASDNDALTVKQATAASLNATVVGTKGTNTAAPSTTNVGVIPALANAAQPSLTEGNQVSISTNLKGSTRTILQDAAGNDRGVNVDASNRATIDNSSWIGSTAPTVGSKTSANSLPVVIASDQGAVPVTLTSTTVTGTVTVAGGKTNNNAAPGATNVGVLPAIATAAIQAWTEGNEVLISTDLSGNTRVIEPDLIVAATGITAANINLFSGTATTNSTVASGTLNGVGVGTFQVTGTYTGLLLPQGTVDGSNWVTITEISNVSSPITQSALTNGQVGIFQIDISGFTKWRVTALSYQSGTATVTLEASASTSVVTVGNDILLDPSTAPTVGKFNNTTEASVVNQTDKGLLERLLDLVQAQNDALGISPGGGYNPNAFRRLDGAGREIINLVSDPANIKTVTLTLSASTTETTLIQGAPGVDNRLLAIIVSNTSAATNTRVDIRDYTAGPVVFSLQSIGAANPVGFSLGGVAIPQNTRGGNWTVQCGTSTTDVRVLAIYSIN